MKIKEIFSSIDARKTAKIPGEYRCARRKTEFGAKKNKEVAVSL
jgi:hypothetical protein